MTLYTVALAQDPDSVGMRTIGGADDDFGYSMEKTSDGGMILCGITASYGVGLRQVWLVKLNADGDQVWSRNFGGSADDEGRYATQTPDGGYIITGTTYSYGAGQGDLWLLKTDSNGFIQWCHTFGGAGNDLGSCVQPTTDGGYIVAGRTASYGAGMSDQYLIKTNSLGLIQWWRAYGGAQDDYAYSVKQLSDGSYILAGYTESTGNGSADVNLRHIEANGTLAWSRTYGGSDADYGASVEQTSDGGFILVGETHSFGAGGGDVWIIKTNPMGYFVWSHTYGGVGLDGAYPLERTADGGYIVGGWTTPPNSNNTNIWLLKLDRLGLCTWEQTIGGVGSERALGVQEIATDSYQILGYTNSLGFGGYDLCLLRFDETDGVVEPSISKVPASPQLSPAFPNPFNSSARFSFVLDKAADVDLGVYDVMGRLVQHLALGNYSAGEHQVALDAAAMTSGIYFVRLATGGMTATRSFTVIR